MSVEIKIFHYTNSSAAISIIRSGRLWATAAAHMNDSEEIIYGLRIIQRIVNTETKLVSPHCRNIILDRLAKLAANRQLWEHVFVACASRDDDAVSQWIGYGHTGGYAIGFTVLPELHWGVAAAVGDISRTDATENLQSTTIQSTILDGVWRPVLYANDEQENYVLDYLQKVSPNFDLFDSSIVSHVADSMLLRPAATLKNCSYESEKEWRCVIGEIPELGRTNFRPGAFGITPYVEISPLNGAGVSIPLTLNEVVVGPSAFASTAEAGVIRLLKNHEFPGATVRSSRSSYRG